ncbi:hypothetical protein GOBAR_AA16155 [Gossypium barbadense]|uniref:Uncharacterized protein n=1 Tax=Gossypium barbadense TaxID=3634 RepID=A0A2P5XMC5_GOSBA|nr:hypothetical protein GOBAR_AA16155 [Gossypium barbadense]
MESMRCNKLSVGEQMIPVTSVTLLILAEIDRNIEEETTSGMMMRAWRSLRMNPCKISFSLLQFPTLVVVAVTTTLQPPPAQSGGNNNNNYTPPPPGGLIGGMYYPPPTYKNYPTPPPPNPIVPYFPFYHHTPPPPSSSEKLLACLVSTLVSLFGCFLYVF